MKKFKTTVAALAATLALGLASLATPALAAPQKASDLAPGSIDAGRSVSLTIHKYADAEGAKGDGKKIEKPTFKKPLSGVKFEVVPVVKDGKAVDLKDPAMWEAIKSLKPDSLGKFKLDEGKKKEVTTAADGSVKVDGLSQSLYLVRESNTGIHTVAKMVAPFLVTLPFPHKDGWIYDAHVYPKNELSKDPSTTKKAVDPKQMTQEGAKVPFTVISTIPAAQQYNLVKVTDVADKKLTVDKSTIQITLNAAGLPLVLDKDYTVKPDITSVSITLTAEGLKKLHTDRENKLIITYEATVKGTGAIQNDASTFVNNPETKTAVATTSTNWGDFKLTKTDKASGAALAGAAFKLYELVNGEPGKEIATYKTDAKGEISDTLFIGTGDVKSKEYVLVENAAPAGYKLPVGKAAQHRLTLKTNDDDSFTQVAVKVTNDKQETFDLPLTGASGRVILALLGAAFAAIAAGAAFVTVRRRRA
ncbi:SpaH/EbpB family LPXTG-anchored major pilin [Trueperella pyogenes]